MRGCKKCRPLNSARMFHNPAPVLQKRAVRTLLKQRKGCRVIEIGAGCLRNSLVLQKAGFKVSVLEVPGMESRFPGNFAEFRKLGGTFTPRLSQTKRFGLGVATFVLETICDKKLRAKIAADLSNSLDESGCVIISVRGPSDLVTAQQEGKRHTDGYITPGYTFARSYTRRQLRTFLTRSGFGRIEFLHRDRTQSPELLHALAWRH
jgi:hypothetical protein